MSRKLPLTILTGFLGSGKTTLATRFFSSPAGFGTGIIVNEFGEIGVDQDLLVHKAKDVQLIANGRAERAEITSAIHEIVRKSKLDPEHRISRILFETSGLADPSAIVAALSEDAWLRAHVELTSVIAVVDAVAGLRNIEEFPEARRQVAICDTVVVTKSDLGSALPLEQIRKRVSSLSPDVRVLDTQAPEFDIVDLFCSRPPMANIRQTTISSNQSDDVRSFVLPLDEPVDWPLFTLWLSALLHRHGDRILRVKGLLFTSASEGALAVHGVQNIMHPPTHLERGQVQPGSSGLVFICRTIDLPAIAASYQRFAARVGGSRTNMLAGGQA